MGYGKVPTTREGALVDKKTAIWLTRIAKWLIITALTLSLMLLGALTYGEQRDGWQYYCLVDAVRIEPMPEEFVTERTDTVRAEFSLLPLGTTCIWTSESGSEYVIKPPPTKTIIDTISLALILLLILTRRKNKDIPIKRLF